MQTKFLVRAEKQIFHIINLICSGQSFINRAQFNSAVKSHVCNVKWLILPFLIYVDHGHDFVRAV
jgi:hypothetical protein